MTVLFPEFVKAKGNLKAKAVLTIASTSAPSLATEINAASSLDVSFFMYGNFAPEITTNTGTAPERWGTTQQLPAEGLTQYGAIELSYGYDPQAADTVDANKAKAMFTPGVTLYLVIRKGPSAETSAYAASQKAEVWKVRLGRQNRGQSGDDEFAEFRIMQMAFPVAPPVENATIAA